MNCAHLDSLREKDGMEWNRLAGTGVDEDANEDPGSCSETPAGDFPQELFLPAVQFGPERVAQCTAGEHK